MEVIVLETRGLPDHAYLSIRVGETKCLRPFTPGQSFCFPIERGSLHFDAFTKLGSYVTSVQGDPEGEAIKRVTMQTATGDTVSAVIKVVKASPHRSGQKHRMALEAKNYMDLHDVWNVIQGMLHAILKSQPSDPISFMLEHLARESAGVVPNSDLGDSRLHVHGNESSDLDVQTPCSACDKLPDLSSHHGVVARVFKRCPAVFERLEVARTRLNVSLSTCIQAGLVLNPSVGIAAGDEHCYEVFREVFDLILAELRGCVAELVVNPSICFHGQAQGEEFRHVDIDTSGRYAISSRLRFSRNLTGLRFPSACDSKERSQVEHLATKALMRLQDEDLRGDYFPLQGSSSYMPKPAGMSDAEKEVLEMESLLFSEHRGACEWPEARGVFVSSTREFAVWVNEEDHLRFISLQLGGDIQKAFDRCLKAMKKMEDTLKEDGYSFAYHDQLSFLSSCPSNLGGMRASILLRLPELVCTSIAKVGENVGLQVRVLGDGGFCEVTSFNRRCSEVDQVNKVVAGCAHLVQLEKNLEQESQGHL